MSANETSFYVTGGTLRHDAPSYVERQADRDLLDGLLKGEFCYVLTSRQMGKSSLMVRAASRLREQGIHVITLDLAAIGQNLSAEQWYNGLLAGIGRQLRLEDELEQFWDKHARLSPVQRLFAAIRDVALARRTGRFVVFIDELDVVRSLPFKTDEFFAAIRSCYNRRTEDAEFNRLTFCLLGVATPSDLIQDTRITPFNIGRRIELHDFSETEAAPLAKGLEQAAGGGRNAELALRQILRWTNGHPYLTQRLCKAVAAHDGHDGGSPSRWRIAPAIDALCVELFLTARAREQDDNLLFVRERLLRNETDLAGLLTLYEQVRSERQPVRDETTDPRVSILRLSGIVRSELGVLKIRNPIYGRVFDHAWVETNMPDAERRRQREAYRRGMVRAASVAGAVVLAMAALVIYARRQATRARNTSTELSAVTLKALQSQARLGRLSGLAGRRFDGLAAVKLAAEIEPSIAVRNEAVACLALADLRTATHWTGVAAEGAAVTFNRTFTRYAWSDGAGSIVVRPMRGEGSAVRLTGFGRPASRVWLSPNQSHLAAAYTGGGEHLLAVWDLGTQRPLLWVTNAVGEPGFDFSPDNRSAAFGDQDDQSGRIRLVDLKEGTTRSLPPMEGVPRRLRFSPDGQRLALARLETLKIELLSVSSGNVVKPLIAPDVAEALAWSEDGALLAAGCRDGGIYVWEVGGEERRDLRGHQGPVAHLAFAHGGGLMASSGVDHTVRLWDADRGGSPIVTLENAEGVQPLQFSEDDRHLACRVTDGRARLFEVAPGLEWRNFFSEQLSGVAEADVSREGRLLACSTADGVAIWDLEAGRQHCVLDLGKAESAPFNPVTGNLVASDFKGVQSVPVRPLETGRGVQIGPAAGLDVPDDAGRLAFSADGGCLAVAQSNGVLVLDARKFAPLSEVSDAGGWRTVALSSNGQWLAAGNWVTGEVGVWEVASSNRVAMLPVGGHAHVAFRPTGDWLATATAREGRLWRVGSWQPGPVFARASAGSGPGPTTFSRDGAMWALGGADGTVDLLDAQTATALTHLEAPYRETLVWLQFSPDGTRLIAAAESKSIQVWDLVALRRGLAELGLDWSKAPIPRGSATTATPLVVSNAVGTFRNESQIALVALRSKLVQITDEIRRRGRTPDRLRRRAEYESALSMYGDAIADWKECVAVQPTNAAVLRDLAWCYLNAPADLRDYAAAREFAQRAVELEPNRSENLWRLGAACFRTEDFTNGLAHLQRAATLRAEGKMAFIRFYEAMCYAELNQLQEARAAFAKALESTSRDGDSPTARAQLAAVQKEAKQLLEARK
jgi:WD40 repeat protein/Flp pilus assembly protein TadD